jgi:hypothetical protein
MTATFSLPAELLRAIDAADGGTERLGDDDRVLIGTVWRHRAESEMTAAVAFADLTRDLFAAPADPAVRFLAARAITDEMLHSEACRKLAARYLRADVPVPAPRGFEAARFGDCPESVNRTLRVVVHCCVNESIGSAMLSACLASSEHPGVRAVLKFLLTDEIDHARIGYGHLSSSLVDDDHRAHVRRATPTLLQLAREAWYAPDAGLPELVPPGHGCLGRDELRLVVEDAISNLVLPGLAAVGAG